MVLPVIGYIDKTGTDVNQRNKLEPFSFTLSILNRGCRFASKAWRVLGFVPDMEHKPSATMAQERNGFLGKGRPSQNYHHCLSVILNSFSSNQGLTTPIYGCVHIGDRVARRRLFFPLVFVIGDALSGDQLCGRYKNYLDKVQHLSHCCDIPFTESDNLNCQCEYLSMTEIQEKCHWSMAFYKLIPSNRELTIMETIEEENIVNDIMVNLQQLSTQLHQSAFCNIWFGDNPNGIYGATPTDLMHAFLHGIIPYVVKLILNPFTNQEKAYLDKLCDRTLATIQSSEQKYYYPRCCFTHDLSRLKLLTASEWAGMALTVALIMRTEEGLKLFTKVCKRRLRNANMASRRAVANDASAPSIEVEHNQPASDSDSDSDIGHSSSDDSTVSEATSGIVFPFSGSDCC